MSTNSKSKINQLLQQVPSGVVILASWLLEQGYSRELQHRYIKNDWLTPVGYGAFKRSGDTPGLKGALYALQKQAGKPVHIGGRTALGMLGFADYLELYQNKTVLFAPAGTTLPKWLTKNKWETKPELIHTSFLPSDSGLVDYQEKTFTIKISGAVRAMLECLQSAPARFDLEEALQIMEGLTTLSPFSVQEILEQCRSIKALRLFLYLAERAGHAWFKYINTEGLYLGKGKRYLVSNGIYIAKYQITVPKSIA